MLKVYADTYSDIIMQQNGTSYHALHNKARMAPLKKLNVFIDVKIRIKLKQNNPEKKQMKNWQLW